jgi:hypothetical protein
MFLIFILSTIEINLYSHKDIYLLGEDIWIWWEIVNKGDSVGYYEKGSEFRILNFGFYERGADSSILHFNHFNMWDVNGVEVHQSGLNIKGAVISKGGKYKIPKPEMLEIEPRDTVKFYEVNLIGVFGEINFEGGLLFMGRQYIKPDEYFLSLLYRIKDDSLYIKVLSDTLHFIIMEPTGEEKQAWELYKAHRRETDVRSGDKVKAVKYVFDILINYPESNYIGSALNHLTLLFRGSILREEREEFIILSRELLDFLEDNIKEYKGRTLKSALWCITYGEIMLLSPADYVRDFIEKNNIPLDEEMQEFFYGPKRTPNPNYLTDQPTN